LSALDRGLWRFQAGGRGSHAKIVSQEHVDDPETIVVGEGLQTASQDLHVGTILPI